MCNILEIGSFKDHLSKQNGKFSSGPLRTHTDAHLTFVSPFEVSVKFVSEAIGDKGNRHTTKTSQLNKFKEKNPLLLN
jgi:hypothetical protein